MKKILFILFILPFIVNGQDTTKIANGAIEISLPDSIVTMPAGARYPERFEIQFPATAVNPVGGVGAATVVDYGIGSALEFSNGSTEIAATDIRFPSSEEYTSNVDTSKQLSIRIGFSNDSNTGNVRLGVKYLYVKDDDVANATEDGEILLTVPANAIAHGFTPATFDLPAPNSDDYAIFIRFTRYGGDALDTNGGALYLKGITLVGTTIQ